MSVFAYVLAVEFIAKACTCTINLNYKSKNYCILYRIGDRVRSFGSIAL